MTDYQKYINALRKCAKEHENDITPFAHIRVSDLCRDTANLLKELEQEPKTGHWIVQPSNKEQGERDFIWWKCSECGQVIYSETEKDRKEYHAFCGRCGAKMVEPQEGSDKE